VGRRSDPARRPVVIETEAGSSRVDPSAQFGETASGRLNAPAIVLLHGTRLSRAIWTPQLDALADEFRVIALDLPGHGERASEPFSLDGAVEVVAATIRARAAGGRAVVVGLSLGGYVAMNLAATYPELVRGLIVAGASAEPVGLSALSYRALAGALTRFMSSRPGRLNAWFFRRRYPPTIAEPIVAGGFWPRGGAEALRSLAGQRFAPRLAAYPGPRLILNGQFDLPFRFAARRFSAAAGDVRRLRLAGAMHLSTLDRPTAFSLAVRDFARSAGPA
jgi:pimeloyl-ACP methyl ester carboxylesterase